MSIEALIKENTEAVRALTQALGNAKPAPLSGASTPAKETKPKAEKPKAEKPSKSAEYTLDDLRALGRKLISEKGKAALVEVLSDAGYESITAVDSGDIRSIYQAINVALKQDDEPEADTDDEDII